MNKDDGVAGRNHAGEPALVSVVIPTHNRPELLRRALGSVIGQTYKRLEIIVIDDASNVDVAPVIESFHDDRIRFIRQDERQGAAAARNRGIEVSKGAYVAFQDDDDEWFSEKIAAQMEDLAKKDWRFKVSYCLGETQNHAEGTTKITSKNGWDGDHLEQLIAGEIRPCGICFLIARECFQKVGGFRLDLRRMQDRELWIRLAEHYQFAFLDRVLARIHVKHGPRISDNFQDRMDAQSTIYRAHRKLFWRHRKALSDYFMNYGFELLDGGRNRQSRFQFARAAVANPLRYEPYLALAISLRKRAQV